MFKRKTYPRYEAQALKETVEEKKNYAVNKVLREIDRAQRAGLSKETIRGELTKDIKWEGFENKTYLDLFLEDPDYTYPVTIENFISCLIQQGTYSPENLESMRSQVLGYLNS